MRLWIVAVLASVVAVSIHSQQSSVSETLEVRLIEVDAVVTDPDGKPVAGLTAEDFELFENGRRQQITNFSEYRETSESASVSEPPDRVAAPPALGIESSVSRPARRTIVLFIDGLKVRGPDRQKLFANLRSLIARTMREGDRAEVLIWNDNGGLRPATTLTTDRSAIEEAIASAGDSNDQNAGGPTAAEYAQFFGSLPGGGGGGEAAQASMRFAAEEELAVMRRKTAAMHKAIAALAQAPGRGVFVYVSEVFPLVAGKRSATPRRTTGDVTRPGDLALRSGYTTRPMLESVIDAANATGVTFYALKPERPWTSPVGSAGSDAEVFNNPAIGLEVIADQVVLQNEVESLSLVAEETGGTFGVGPQAVEEVVERIVTDLGSYYTLAYRAPTEGRDRTRRIDVRAKNPNYTVRSRRAVVEKSDRTRARDLLLAKLFEAGPGGEIDFEVTAGRAEISGKRARTPVTLSIPAERLAFRRDGKELAAQFTVMTVTGLSLQTTGEVAEQSQRVTAPLDGTPQGPIKFTFTLLHDLQPMNVAVGVFDQNSGLSGMRRLTLSGGVVNVSETRGTESWENALARAAAEKKPIVVFERPAGKLCTRPCTAFEQSISHPAVQRRLSTVVFVTRTAHKPTLVLFDWSGQQLIRYDALPADMPAFGAILDSLGAVKPLLERSIHRASVEGPEEGHLDLAAALVMMGRPREARAAVARASERGSGKTREMAVVVRSMIDANEGKHREAFTALEELLARTDDPEVAANAWMSLGALHRGAGAMDQAIAAYSNAVTSAYPGSETQKRAEATVAALQLAQAAMPPGPIRLLPQVEQIVTGRRTVRTAVGSASVARVVFSVDGVERATVTRPPFSTVVDFGRIPQPRTIRAVAFDDGGKEVGRHELTVNNAGEMFWIRLLEPREGTVSGAVRVTTTMRAPAQNSVKRVVVSWNDAELAALSVDPWQADVQIPAELGILRVVAELEDGRRAEDAVLLNATGHVERSDVPLVEIPVTITENDGNPSRVSPADVVIRERRKPLPIESIISSDQSPLTVGLVFDASHSMQNVLLDVQEAALGFLESALGPKDRAFLIAFDTTARLLQMPTSDLGALRSQIMAMRANGYTALHDAMILGLLQFEGVKGRRALIVFTDGDDSASRYTARDVEDLSRRSNIPIYLIAAPRRGAAVGLITPPGRVRPAGDRSFDPRNVGDPKMVQFAELMRVIRSTGGITHRLDQLAQLPEAYALIERSLRAQTLVVVRTEAGRNESDWRTIDVEVTGRRDARGPAGYFAPW